MKALTKSLQRSTEIIFKIQERAKTLRVFQHLPCVFFCVYLLDNSNNSQTVLRFYFHPEAFDYGAFFTENVSFAACTPMES